MHITAASARPAADGARAAASLVPVRCQRTRRPCYPVGFLLILVAARAQTQAGLDWRPGTAD
jgi:hypothetical protein